MSSLFEIENLQCSYDKDCHNRAPKVVLDIRRLMIPRGKRVFIVGESGIGKSTILETLGMMNNTMVVNQNTKALFYEDDNNFVDMAALWSQGDDVLSEFRLKHFSFIFQSTNLMRNFSAYENIALTRMLQGYSRAESFERASEVLNDLGLGHINKDRMTQELSGGQQQRLAFARAILPDFTVLFGDEPTGNLDGDNAVKVMTILSSKLLNMSNSSAIIVSHDMRLAEQFADIIIKIRKTINHTTGASDEVAYYGVIDDSCVFTPQAEGNWSNGVDSYTPEDFEHFLKS